MKARNYTWANSKLVHNIEKTWREHYRYNNSWISMDTYFVDDVLSQILKLDSKKHLGIMNTTSDNIKKHNIIFSELLSELFTACAETMWIPEEWRHSVLLHVPKKGDPSLITKYRGIAISSVIPNIFDATATMMLVRNLDPKIHHSQHGFRQMKGTPTCLLEAINYIQESLQSSARVDVAFIDLAKAFDRISPTIILQKLASIGTPLVTCVLIMRFIMFRKYSIQINGILSDDTIESVTSVPQGSHLGPALFILANNDLINSIPPSRKLLVYADDIMISKNIRRNKHSIYSVNGATTIA